MDPAPDADTEPLFRAVADTYSARRAALASIASDLNRRSSRVSALRGVTFLAAAGLGGYALFRVAPPFVLWIAGLAAASFVALVIAHAVLITKEATVNQRIKLVDRALNRLAGKPPAQEREARPAPPDHPYAKDLDIFGKASLFQALDTTQTEPGESLLAGWLSAPSPAADIAPRQEAVRELAKRSAFREDLAVEGLAADTKGRAVAPLVAWAESPSAFAGTAAGLPKMTLVVVAAVLVTLTVLLIALDQIAGGSMGVWRRAWVVPLVLQLGVLGALRPSVEPLLAAAASRQAPFGRYRGLFERVEAEPLEAPRLAALRATIRGQNEDAASGAMRSLERIIGYADLRHNGLIHVLVNTVVLWDVWCALALERWRARAGMKARAWFAALGEIEALASLATYTYEHPDHTFPEVESGPSRFEAEGLGHPLLPRGRRVVNDVALPEPGDALLVTGSNMSGKSTLLRAMGINAVMAQAGAPVCARSLRMTEVAVRTSMRIDDSLEQGISHFYAELHRLKSIVDAVNEGHKVLFLLDEILHGTNSAERHIGARAVVLHVIKQGAIGAVSSHDLALADLAEASQGHVRNVHFEEIIRDGRMAFDYTLKEGVVRTTNALRLMKLIGIDVSLP